MRAWVFTSSGTPQSVLSLRDVPIPVDTSSDLPTETSVLVRVSHVGLQPGASILTSLVPFIFRHSPAIAETDFSGVVVKVGKEVSTRPPGEEESLGRRSFPVGTAVFGSITVPAHLKKGYGALAEYLIIEVDAVARKPDNVTFAEAAGLAISGCTALTLVDAARLIPGSKILLNASCGGIGHFVTQLVSHIVRDGDQHGEARIVGLCSSAKFELAKQLGCDEALDYHDLSILFPQLTRDRDARFHTMLDCYGDQQFWYSSESLLKPGSDHLHATVGPALKSHSIGGALVFFWKMATNVLTPTWLGGVNRTYKPIFAVVDTAKLERLRKLTEEKILKPHVGGVWELEDALKAYDVLLGGHATGKLVIRVWEP